jgi:transposase InsO family protein
MRKPQQARLTVGQVCEQFGYSRDAYYKAMVRQQARDVDEDKVLGLVHRERHLQPNLSGRKVYRLIQEDLTRQGIKMGRDKLYELLGRYGLLIERKPPGARTTDSSHGWRRYKNLLSEREIDAPHQVWVCDITYLRTLQGFVYLCLIMDAYSRKIVGWCMHDSLEMEGCLKALKMAFRNLPNGADLCKLVHHSDQGVQYCCKAYTRELNKRGIQISMAARGNCYENAKAERLNGILKQEYGLGKTIRTKQQAARLCRQAIELYNNRRPHLALQLATPQQVHQGKKVKVKMSWKKEQVAKAA